MQDLMQKETENKIMIRKALQKLETYNNLILKGKKNMQEKDKSLILEDVLKMSQILHDWPMPCIEMTKAKL